MTAGSWPSSASTRRARACSSHSSDEGRTWSPIRPTPFLGVEHQAVPASLGRDRLRLPRRGPEPARREPERQPRRRRDLDVRRPAVRRRPRRAPPAGQRVRLPGRGRARVGRPRRRPARLPDGRSTARSSTGCASGTGPGGDPAPTGGRCQIGTEQSTSRSASMQRAEVDRHVSLDAWSTPPAIVQTASSWRRTVRRTPSRVGQLARLVDDAQDRDVGRAAGAQRARAPAVRRSWPGRWSSPRTTSSSDMPELEEARHRRRQVDDRSFDRIAMEIGADRVGHEALGERLVGGRPREAPAAVADIEPDAAFGRAMRLRPGSGRRSPRIPVPDAVKAWVTTSPGRIRSRAVGTSAPSEMWAISGTPARVAASSAASSAAATFAPQGSVPRRTFTPTMTSRWSRDDRRGLARAGVAHVVQLADERRDQARGRHVEEGQDADGRRSRSCAGGTTRSSRSRSSRRRSRSSRRPPGWPPGRGHTGCRRTSGRGGRSGRASPARPADVDEPVVGRRRHAAARRPRPRSARLDDDVAEAVDAGRRVDQPSTREDDPRHSRDRTQQRGAA